MTASHAPSAAGGAPPLPPPAKCAVAWECTVPASCAGLRLHEALQWLQPEQFPTMTAAKMAVSRAGGREGGLAWRAACLGHTWLGSTGHKLAA